MKILDRFCSGYKKSEIQKLKSQIQKHCLKKWLLFTNKDGIKNVA